MSFEVTFELRAKKYKMVVDPSELISKVKTRLVDVLKDNGVSVNQSELRLIFGAKILDDTKTIEESKVVENSKVFLTVRTKPATTTTNSTTIPQPTTQATNTSQMFHPGIQMPPLFPNNPQAALASLQNNPEMQAFALQQIGTFVNNPQLIDMLFPTEFCNKSEAEKDALRNTLLAQFKMVHSNPEIMNSMLQSMSQNNGPFGFNPMSSPTVSPLNMGPHLGQVMGQNLPQQPNPLGQQGMASGFVPCPHGCYAINYILQPQNTNQQSPINIPQDAKTKYADKLQALKDMGFNNEDENIKALVRANGDLNLAVEILVQSTITGQ